MWETDVPQHSAWFPLPCSNSISDNMYKYSEALKWGDEGWGGGGDFYKHIKEAALVIMAPQGNLLDMPGCGGHHFAPMNESQLLTDLSKRCGRTSLQAKTTPE